MYLKSTVRSSHPRLRHYYLCSGKIVTEYSVYQCLKQMSSAPYHNQSSDLFNFVLQHHTSTNYQLLYVAKVIGNINIPNCYLA